MTIYNYKYVRSDYEKECLKRLHKDYMRKTPLQVEIVENGVILPNKSTVGTEFSSTWMGMGGVVDNKGNFVELSGIPEFGENEGVLAFGGKYEYGQPEKILDEEVLYMGAYHPHWGHFLLEYCTRLWYYIKFKLDIRIAYCGFSCEQNDMGGNFLEFLNLLGIKKEQLIDIREATKVHKIIIPEQSFLRDKYITNEYRMLIDYAYQNISKSNMVSYDKIYFTRVDYANIKEQGEKEIRDILEKNGYTCLAPEKLTASEQVFLVRNCKEFVAIPGGASMNGVFAANNTKKVYLKKAYLPELPGDVFQINQLTKASEVIFVDCYYKPYKSFPKRYSIGPHFLGVTKEFKSYLKDYHMNQFIKGRCYIALIKNWIWLTSLLLCDVWKKLKDIFIYNKIKFNINKILIRGNEKFIIYPYGKWGNMAKSILEKKKNIRYILIDHYKCVIDKNIYDINVLDDSKYYDYKILVCCDKKSIHYNSVKATIYNQVIDKKRLIKL